MIATSTDTDPESLKNTCWSGSGVMSISSRASSTAGSWVRPPNITCAILCNWLSMARLSRGWLYPWMTDHQDAMPSTSSRPSASLIRTPSADTTW